MNQRAIFIEYLEDNSLESLQMVDVEELPMLSREDVILL
jgi:hypothetical protein